MFSVSTGKLSKEEKETLITNAEKAEKLYDKYKNKFEEYTTKKEEEANNESSIFLDVSLEKVDVTETNFTSDSPPPPIGNGEYIGQIKLGSGEDKDNYVWNGEIWSKVIDNKDGSYSAFIYGKNNSRYFLVATWKKSDNFSTIETKVLRAKNGANLAGVYMDNWDIMTFPLEAPVAIYQFNYNNLATTARYKNIRKSNNINKNISPAKSKVIKGNIVNRELWNGVKNIFKATADEVAEATQKIKNYRTTNKIKGKNIGYLEGNVNGKTIDNRMWLSGKVEKGEPQIFKAIEVEGSGGRSWLRNTDSEYKMLNKLAEDLGGKYNSNIKGEIKIISELPYCNSCTGVIQQFNEMFPNVKITLIDGVK